MNFTSIGMKSSFLFSWIFLAMQDPSLNCTINTDQDICGPKVLYAQEEPEYMCSVGYPIGYLNNLDCEWILQAPEGQQVQMTLEHSYTEPCCDTLELRDGNSSSAGLLARYRGRSKFSSYVSTFGSLHVRFRSDGSDTSFGYLLKYEIARTNKEKCGAELTATSKVQYLTSPHYPNYYSDLLYCKWTITAPKGKSILITTDDVHTEECCDYLLIRFGTEMFDPIKDFRGKYFRPRNLVSPSNLMEVFFRSDYSNSERGFKLSYRAVDQTENPLSTQPEQEKCGGVIKIPPFGHGTISTPNYPNNHPNNLNCVWLLRAPPKERVAIWFTSINTESCCDFILVRDGPLHTSKKLTALSGSVKDLNHRPSSSNVLRVEFQSDSSGVDSGFRAVYEVYSDSSKQECGGVLRAKPAERQYISNPNWPADAFAQKCTWRITAPIDFIVVFRVIGFHSEESQDSLEFYNGSSSTSFATMRDRGNHGGDSTFRSDSNTMVITFSPDPRYANGGFKAYFEAEQKKLEAVVSTSPDSKTNFKKP